MLHQIAAAFGVDVGSSCTAGRCGAGSRSVGAACVAGQRYGPSQGLVRACGVPAYQASAVSPMVTAIRVQVRCAGTAGWPGSDGRVTGGTDTCVGVARQKLRCSYTADMSELHFKWDERQAAANEKKHGVSFEEARSVFSDELAKLIDDPDHSGEEDRFILLGLSSSLQVFVICKCDRGEGNVVRINSARKATTTESKFYP